MKQKYPAAQANGLSAIRMAVIIVLCTLIAGCYRARYETAEIYPSDYRERHPIIVQEGNRTIDLSIDNKLGKLSDYQRADIVAFANDWQREAKGGIVIQVPTAASDPRAVSSTLRAIKSTLASAGIPLGTISEQTFEPGSARRLAAIRLSYSKIIAKTGPCGFWPADLGPSFKREYLENKPYWNYGCATQHNLAAMVDNPEDLVQPRGETPPYTAQRTIKLDKYRKGDSTNSENSSSSAAKISDVAK